MDDTNSDDEDAGSCKVACCLDDDDKKSGNKCLAVHHTCLGYIFPRLMSKVVDKMDRKPVLLIAGRKVPKNHCSRIQVYAYLTVMAVLTGLWFLVTLLEQVIYHSATSCDDIIGPDDSRYHICFDLSVNWTIVDCQTYLLKNHSTVNILCYTYSVTPSAFGIAFSVASFVSTVISITFYSAIYCSDERCSRRGLVVIQFLFVLALVCCAVSIGVLYATEEQRSLVDYFIDERAPLRGALYALFGVSLLLGSCLPWAPFRNKTTYETVASDQP